MDEIGTAVLVCLLLAFAFLFYGDPGLWDKLVLIAHGWADSKLGATNGPK